MGKKFDLGTRLKVRSLLMDRYTYQQIAHLLHLSLRKCRAPRCTSKIIHCSHDIVKSKLETIKQEK